MTIEMDRTDGRMTSSQNKKSAADNYMQLPNKKNHTFSLNAILMISWPTNRLHGGYYTSIFHVQMCVYYVLTSAVCNMFRTDEINY